MYQRLFSWGKAVECDAEPSLPATAKIRNAESYTSTLRYLPEHRDKFTFTAVMTTIQPKTNLEPTAEILCILNKTQMVYIVNHDCDITNQSLSQTLKRTQ
jgi:hypothetical protein